METIFLMNLCYFTVLSSKRLVGRIIPSF